MTITETEELTPALFDHAKTLYEEMLKRSHKEQLPDVEVVVGTTPHVDVYEGHLTRLFAELALPNPYYTKILNALKGQNCIEQLRRGGGVAFSKWVLNCPPTEEGFKRIMERKRAPKGKQAELEQRVQDLTKWTNRLEERLGIVEERLHDHEQLHKD
jgi:hypothetical protein